MAGTERDPNTPEWWLLSAELAFVAELCRFEPVAKELLLEWLHDKHIRHRCQSLEFDGGGFTRGANRFFFRRATYSRITVDWKGSCASRVGPSWQVQRDPEGNTWPFYRLDQPIISLRMRLIWLHHGDVVDKLRRAGLLPPVATTSPLPPSPGTKPAIPAAKEAARLGPAQWVIYVPDRFPEKPESETRAKYFDRVWKQMRKELGQQAWSREYLERRCYELELLKPRQPRQAPTKPR